MDELFKQLRISEVEKYPEIITNYAKEDEEFSEDMDILAFYDDDSLTAFYGYSKKDLKKFQKAREYVMKQTILSDIEWISIPEGSFQMGKPDSDRFRQANFGETHVTLSSYKMSKNLITFRQYDKYCKCMKKRLPKDEFQGRGKNPVFNVSWHQATEFAEWLGCRLPTDAEWEYACKTGSSLPFTGEGITLEDANLDNILEIKMIGSYPSNSWGLNDMIGNVYEWCSDWANRLPSEPQINPTGPTEGDFKITRGGSYKTSLNHIGLLYKGFAEPKDAFNDIGFRLVLVEMNEN